MSDFNPAHGYNYALSYLQELRMQVAFAPRTRQRPRSEFHDNMLAHELDRFQYYRPGYIDGPEAMGFIQEPHDWGVIYRPRDPKRIIATNGMEVPYWGTKVWLKALGRAMKHAFWAEVHRAMGTMDNVGYSDRTFAVIKGITS
jgi:hypothetical protein